MGTTSDLRMLASVTASRRVIVSEEPANDGSPYFINSDGSWDDKYSNKIRKELCPVGIWARAKDAVPASVDSNYISDPSLAFIEENEYDVINDELNYSARGAPDPWEFPMVKDG
jgi:hypothetical protein